MTPVLRRVAAHEGAPVAAMVLLAVLLVAACGAATSTASPAASPSAEVAPSGSPGASASEAIGPSPTAWPGGVVEAVVLLGKADAEIQKAGGDLGARFLVEEHPDPRPGHHP